MTLVSIPVLVQCIVGKQLNKRNYVFWCPPLARRYRKRFHKKSENSCDEQPQTGTKGEVKRQRLGGDHAHLRGLKFGKSS